MQRIFTQNVSCERINKWNIGSFASKEGKRKKQRERHMLIILMWSKVVFCFDFEGDISF